MSFVVKKLPKWQIENQAQSQVWHVCPFGFSKDNEADPTFKATPPPIPKPPLRAPPSPPRMSGWYRLHPSSQAAPPGNAPASAPAARTNQLTSPRSRSRSPKSAIRSRAARRAGCFSGCQTSRRGRSTGLPRGVLFWPGGGGRPSSTRFEVQGASSKPSSRGHWKVCACSASHLRLDGFRLGRSACRLLKSTKVAGDMV